MGTKMQIKRALSDKNISVEAVAALLGIHRNSAANKLNGATPFSIEEAFKLKSELLPEYDIEYLFTNNSSKAS